MELGSIPNKYIPNKYHNSSIYNNDNNQEMQMGEIFHLQ